MVVIQSHGDTSEAQYGDLAEYLLMIRPFSLLVDINGEDFTNTWSDKIPERIDGNYYNLITVNYIDGSTATVTLSPQELSTAGASYPLD